jgi:hypothetical protein
LWQIAIVSPFRLYTPFELLVRLLNPEPSVSAMPPKTGPQAQHNSRDPLE